jgi:hypothetical protein
MCATDSAYLCAALFLFCFFGKEHKGKDKNKEKSDCAHAKCNFMHCGRKVT